MRPAALATLCLCLAASPVLAQTADTSDAGASGEVGTSQSNTGGTQTMAELLKQGYEIKAAVPSGTDKLIIFMQNEKSAYACEFTNLANTRCGSIN